LTGRLEAVHVSGMGKQLRFGDLVRDSGRPKTVALWTKPEDNPELTRAIKQNRVLTVLQESGKKDHGLIGFKVLPGALYLEFPKILPDANDAVVIGINYQLIDEPPVPEEDRAKPAKPPPARPRPAPATATHPSAIKEPDLVVEKPKPQEFTIKVRRTASVEEEITVKAMDKADAEKQALERARHIPFKPKSEVKVELVK
jgi:hypothetical protein